MGMNVVALNLTYEVRRPPRWDTFLLGLAVEAAGLLLAVIVGAHVTTVVPRQSLAKNYTPLVLPASAPVQRSQVARLEAPKVAVPIAVKPLEMAKTAAPKVKAKIEAPKPDLSKVATAAPAAPVKPAHPGEIKTNVFGASGSGTATVKRPAREVQMGGFGDPNGVTGQGDPKRNTVTVASVGSFDLPNGPGKGNGTGGSRGVSGTIRSSGFADGAATAGPHGSGHGTVVASGFGDVVAQNSGSGPLQVQKKPDVEPVEIVYKPRPAYTAEARRLRVEGEVLLEVVFTASGSLQIRRVVKGLGYGLDDAALAAAQHIRFRPARKDGQPYDCAALVHMVFELAE